MDNPPEYLPTFWVYLQKADDNDAKRVVLTALQQALVQVPQQVPVAPGLAQTANSTQNIATSQAMQTPQSKPNRGDIAQGVQQAGK